MVYENNKIDSSVISMVANAYRQKLLDDVNSRKKEIRESSLSPEAKKKNYDDIDKMQTNRIKQVVY